MEYIESTDTIIISPEFNKVLTNKHIEIISKYNQVIFSNYELDDNLFEAYEKKFFHIKPIYSIFNNSVDNLPNSITHFVLKLPRYYSFIFISISELPLWLAVKMVAVKVVEMDLPKHYGTGICCRLTNVHVLFKFLIWSR